MSWFGEARGKAFKMVSMLLFDLPSNWNYKVMFMERDTEEMLVSQAKMLDRLGKGGDKSDAQTKDIAAVQVKICQGQPQRPRVCLRMKGGKL